MTFLPKLFTKAPSVSQQDVDSQSSNSPGPKQRKNSRRKEPFAIRRWTLISLALILVLVLVGLILLFYYASISKDGLEPFSHSHYVLAYIPTAAMVVLVATWRQVDYQCKVFTPWDELSQRQANASKSILLDYVSDFQATSWVRAIRNRHIAVVLSISGFIILKLVTLASTGLMVLQPSSVYKDSSINRLTYFDGQLFNRSSVNNLQDEGPVYAAYGVAAKNLPYPPGTENTLAYETFSNPSETASDFKFSVNTTALVPRVHCLPVEVEMQGDPIEENTSIRPSRYQLISPCNVTLPREMNIQILNPAETQTPSRQLSGTWVSLDDQTLAECSRNAFGPELVTPGWFILSLAEVQYNQTVNETAERFEPVSWAWNVTSISSTLCQIGYEVHIANISAQGRSTLADYSVLSSTLSDVPHLVNFTGSDLTWLVDRALRASVDMFGVPSKDEMIEEVPSVVFKSMAAIDGKSYETLIKNSSIMVNTAEKFIQNVAIQALSANLRQPDSGTAIPSLLIFDVVRLRLDENSLWVMVSGFAFVILCLAAIFVTRPRSMCPGALEDIGFLGLILSQSPDMQRLLGKSGKLKPPHLISALSENRYSLLADDSSDQTRIEVHECPATLPRAHPETCKCSSSFWTPLTLQQPVLILTLALPLVAIALLEGLQHLSDRPTGIAIIKQQNDFLENAYSHYFPALVLLLIATLFNCLDFNVLALTPYNAFKSKALPAICFRSSSLNGQVPLMAFWKSIRFGHKSASFSLVAAFGGSLLAIIVSGLYTIDIQTSPLDVQLASLGGIQSNWSDSVSNDNGAAIISSLIESLNLSYPESTYGELAFPRWNFDRQHSPEVGLTNSQSIILSSSAYRTSLDCVTLPASAYTVKVEDGHVIKSVLVNGTYKLPPTCQFGGDNGTDSTLIFTYTFPLSLYSNDSYLGKMLDLHVGPYQQSQFSAVTGAGDETNIPNNPAGLGCPSLAFIYGYAPLTPGADAKARMNAAVCYQRLQRVQANVTLKYPDLSIDTQAPPTVDEGSVRYVKADNNISDDPQAVDTAMQYRIQANIATGLATFNTGTNSSTGAGNSSSSSAPNYNPLISNSGGGSGAFPAVDQFFQTMLFGRKPTALSHMNLASAQDRDAIIHGIQAFYRRYMAQAISANMRMTATMPTTTVPAVMPRGTVQRKLVQHNKPKIALQVILAVMFVCGCAAVFTCQLRALVPLNPCTIAGQMVLWCGCEGVRQPPSTERQRVARTKFRQAMETAQRAEYESNSGGLLQKLGRHRKNNADNEVKFGLGFWEEDTDARENGAKGMVAVSGVEVDDSERGMRLQRRYGFAMFDDEMNER